MNTKPNPQPADRSLSANAWRLGLIALAYALTLKLTLFLPDAKGVITGLWPPGGVALAALLLNPPRRWAAILAVIFVTGLGVDLVSGRPGLACVGFMLANGLESWGCAWVLTRICGGRRVNFESVVSVLALGVGAIFVNGLTALLGAAAARLVSPAPFLDDYLDWWIADGLGILLVTPLVIVCAQSSRLVFSSDWRQRLEAAALVLVWCALAGLAFLGTTAGLPVTPRPYWILVPLVWSALRFGTKVTTVLLALLAVIAIGLTASGRGDFSLGGGNLLERLRMVQFFLGVVVLTGLTLAAVVTERKQAARALQESEEHYRAVVTDQTEIIARFRPDGTITFVNEAFCRFFGRTSQELIGSQWCSLPVAEAVPMIQKKLRALSLATPVVQIENRVYAGSGEVCWMQFINRALFDTNGRHSETQSIGRDITERKQAEAALRRSQERYELTSRAVNDGFWDWNILTDEDYFSPRWKGILGYQDQELANTKAVFFDLLHPEDLARVKEVTRAHLEERQPYAVEFRLRHKDGSYRWVFSRGQAIRDAADRPVRMVGATTDISERKSTEAALQASELRYRRLFESAKDGVLILDFVTGMVVDVNPFLVRLLDYSHAEFLGKKVWELGFLKDIIANEANFAELQAMEYLRYADLALEARDGRRIEVEFVSNVYRADGCKVIQCNIRDITETKKREAQNRALQKAESLERMAGAIAHHFNNQLAAVIGNLELLQSEPPRTAESAEFLSEAMGSALKATEMSRLMLTYLGQTHGLREPQNLADLCRRQLHRLQAAMPRTVSLETNLPTTGPVIKANAPLIEQLLAILLTNAWEACGNEPGTIRLSVQTVSPSVVALN